MTMPDERTRAVIYTQQFLRSLMDPKETPRVPKEIRLRAMNLLRHYPWPLYIDISARAVPDVWGRVNDE